MPDKCTWERQPGEERARAYNTVKAGEEWMDYKQSIKVLRRYNELASLWTPYAKLTGKPVALDLPHMAKHYGMSVDTATRLIPVLERRIEKYGLGKCTE